MIQKKIRSTAIGIGITGGVILGMAYILKRTNAGENIIKSLQGLGQTVGLGITKPFTGILEGITQGGGELQNQAMTTGADFQEAITGNRNAISDFFSGGSGGSGGSSVIPQAFGNTIDEFLGSLDKIQARPTNIGNRANRPNVRETSLNLSNIFSDSAVASRLNKTIVGSEQGRYRDNSTGKRSDFGGYGTASNQEIALRKAIEESKLKYPEWFD